MKVRRAIGFAVLTYILTMIVGVIVGMIIGFENIDMTNPPIWMYVVSGVTAALFGRRMSYLYFRSPKVAKGIKYGAYLGLYMVATGCVLDILSWSGEYAKTGSFDGLWVYYSNPCFRIALIVIFLVCVRSGKRAARQ